MDTLEKRIMDKMKAEFEPLDTKPKKKMMIMEEEMSGGVQKIDP